MSKQRPWTSKEVQILREKYGKVPMAELLRLFPERNRGQIYAAAQRLKVHAKPQLRELEAEILRLHELGKSLRDISRLLFVPASTIQSWYRRLNLKPNFAPSQMPETARVARRNAIWRQQAKLRKERSTRHLKREYDPPAKTMHYYQAEEEEFLRAVLAFRNKHKRPPTLQEGFRLALKLGWKKPG